MDRTAITLAIVSAIFFTTQAVAVAARCYHRIQANKYAAKDLRVGAVGWALDDYIIFVAYTLAIANWMLFIWAGFQGLGTDNVLEHESLVQTLLLALQTLLIISNFPAKSSFALLLARIATTQSAIELLSRSLCALMAVLGIVAALVVIVPCWPQARSAPCLHDSYRWIVLTVVDVATELIIIAFPLYALRNMQFRSVAQKYKLALVIILGRCSTIPLAISFCVVMLRSSAYPFLGPQILDALERQQGGLFTSLLTSTLIPVFNLFQITKIELVESDIELRIKKTIEVRVEDDKQQHNLTSSAASLSPSTQADTRELLDRQFYDHRM
nr:hypothetical protein B0A51_04516 [Rachicladosporium sp. CCFEE 5018]